MITLGRGILTVGMSKIFCDFGKPVGVKELYESPTYRWQKYDVISTYYWDKYTVQVRYGTPIITTPTDNRNLQLPSTRYDGTSTSTGESYICYTTTRVYKTCTIDPESGNVSITDNVRLAYNYRGNNPWHYPDRYSSPCYSQAQPTDPILFWPDGCIVGDGNRIAKTVSIYSISERPGELITSATKIESKGSLIASGVTSTSVSTYPTNGKHADGYWYHKTARVDRAKGDKLIGTVTSKVSTQYPENGFYGGHWYVQTA